MKIIVRKDEDWGDVKPGYHVTAMTDCGGQVVTAKGNTMEEAIGKMVCWISKHKSATHWTEIKIIDKTQFTKIINIFYCKNVSKILVGYNY